MNSQSNTQRQDAADHEISGLEPIQDNGLVGSSPDVQIHKTKTGDPADADRCGKNEPARVDPVEKSMKQKPGPTSTSSLSEREEVDWGTPDMMRTGGLERIKPEKNSGRSVRFAFLPFLKPRRARTHWLMTETGMISRICLKQGDSRGYCCWKLREQGEYRVVALAIEYTNAGPTGDYSRDYEGPIEWRIGYVELSRSDFRTVLGLAEEGASVTDRDFAMTMWGNLCEFKVKPGKALWRLEPTLARAVREVAKPFVVDGGARLAEKLGKLTTLDEWKALLNDPEDPFLKHIQDM